MLPLVKRNSRITLVISLVIYAVTMLFILMYSGDITYGAFTILFATLIFFLVIRWVKNTIDQRTIDKLRGLISIYEDECDPERFSEAAAEQVAGATKPYSVFSSWFIGYFTRALYEAGHTDEARSLFDILRKNVDEAPDDINRAESIINLVPATRMILGGRYALDALQEADALLKKVGFTEGISGKAYANWERGNLEAQRDGNLDELVERMRKARENNRNSTLVRVDCAEREALVHQSKGDVEAERECLEYVVQNGGKLNCVARAQARLAALA